METLRTTQAASLQLPVGRCEATPRGLWRMVGELNRETTMIRNLWAAWSDLTRERDDPFITLGEAVTLIGGMALMMVGVCMLLLY